jgi:hypothetical protein
MIWLDGQGSTIRIVGPNSHQGSLNVTVALFGPLLPFQRIFCGSSTWMRVRKGTSNAFDVCSALSFRDHVRYPPPQLDPFGDSSARAAGDAGVKLLSS